MKIRYIISVFIGMCILSCSKQKDKSTLKKMLKSGDINHIIEATNYISYNKETSMVGDMLEHTFDPRITHIITHKGMSVYQIKMAAMKEMTGKLPPNKTTYKPDSVNIRFYINVAIKHGWIK
jgi:hypothetical protein